MVVQLCVPLQARHMRLPLALMKCTTFEESETLTLSVASPSGLHHSRIRIIFDGHLCETDDIPSWGVRLQVVRHDPSNFLFLVAPHPKAVVA